MLSPITHYRMRPVVLVILDGWGVAPPGQGNAITSARTPHFERLLSMYQVFLIQASGEAVGLPRGEIGSSEVGHLNIGAGRIVYYDLAKINHSIASGVFFTNPAFLQAIDHVKQKGRALHVIGLLSDAGVHSYFEHLIAFLDLCKQQQVPRVFIHAILDGRDVPYNSGVEYVTHLERLLSEEYPFARIATLSGRWWSMDRDTHWERTEAAYRAMVEGVSSEPEAASAVEAVRGYYARTIFDEEIPPTVIAGTLERGGRVSDHDVAVFFNFRADRARQLTRAFVDPAFTGFTRTLKEGLFFVTMTRYDERLPARIAFPPEDVPRPLARVVSDAGMRQFHIGESEKYAHVTYFIDGGREESFQGEEKVLVASPRVDSYASMPEMSARQITDRVIVELERGEYDLYIINYANADLVGHTGDLTATIRAVESIDEQLGRLSKEVIALGGALLITADHGNAEMKLHPMTGEINKEHTTSPVPCIICGEPWRVDGLVADTKDLSVMTPRGLLADIAPTLLKIMGLEPPAEMTGRSLV